MKTKAEYWIIDTEKLDQGHDVMGPFPTQLKAEQYLADDCAAGWKDACGCLRKDGEQTQWCQPFLIVKVVRRVLPEFEAKATLKDVKP